MDKFSALAEPTRRQIIEMLASRGQLSVTDISKKFYITPPAISQHLKVLREAKLVQMEKHAQKRIYRINPYTMSEFASWAKQMTDTWNQRLDALDTLLKIHKRRVVKK